VAVKTITPPLWQYPAVKREAWRAVNLRSCPENGKRFGVEKQELSIAFLLHYLVVMQKNHRYPIGFFALYRDVFCLDAFVTDTTKSNAIGWQSAFRSFPGDSACLYSIRRRKPTMAINVCRNKPIGPGGGTRRLHHSPCRGLRRGRNRIDEGVKGGLLPGMVPPLSGLTYSCQRQLCSGCGCRVSGN
jgi:hypothetical protein